MKRIAVISDSHGGKLHLEQFVKLCKKEKYDMVFHLGDMEDDARWLRGQIDIPVTCVAGNCDFHPREDREHRLTVEGRRILLTHGDRYGVKYGCDRLSYYAEEQKMDCALFGHTHKAFAACVGPVLLVNPGALRNGRLCVLEVSERDIVPQLLDMDTMEI